MTSPAFRVERCSYDAAKYAVLNWHYSRSMPSGKLVKFGAWEKNKFIGAVIFGRGTNRHIGSEYGLDQFEVCELVRVALTTHETPVSQIVSQSLKLLKQSNTGLRLVISYADPEEGHTGGIYRAGNWLFVGAPPSMPYFIINGKKTHSRTAYIGGRNLEWYQKNVDPDAQKITPAPKLKFAYPLDKQTRRKVAKMALPYPNAVEGLKVSRSDSVAEVLVQSQPTARKSK
jgi:hypothetical protein